MGARVSAQNFGGILIGITFGGGRVVGVVGVGGEWCGWDFVWCCGACAVGEGVVLFWWGWWVWCLGFGGVWGGGGGGGWGEGVGGVVEGGGVLMGVGGGGGGGFPGVWSPVGVGGGVVIGLGFNGGSKKGISGGESGVLGGELMIELGYEEE